MNRPRKFFAVPLLAALVLSIEPTQAGETNRLNGVVAIVNDSVITAQQVYTIVEQELPRLRLRYSTQPARYREELSRLEAAALESLIERQLVLSDYKNAGFNIPETLIDDQFQQDMVSRFGDRVAFVKTLQKEGKTIEEARKEFRELLIVNIMSAQKIRNQVTISPFKIERYYEANQDKYTVEDQVQLRMIILPAQGENDAAALEKARDILRQMAGGTTFEDMARQHSSGVQAKDGGMMGWNGRKELRRELVETAFSLSAGAVSEPIPTEDAVFILKVEATKPKHVQPLTEVRDEIEQTLRSEESARRRKQWIDGIREKSFVRLF